MACGRFERIWWIGFLVFFVAGLGQAHAQKLPDVPGISIALPNLIDPKIKLPTIIDPDKGGPTVRLPALALPNISFLDTKGLPPNLSLPAGDRLLLINLPGISIVGPNLPVVSGLGNSLLNLLLNQVSGVNQLLSNTVSLNLLGPIDQIINGLTLGDGPTTNSPSASNNGSVSLVALPLSNLWTWNAVTFGSGNHGGYSYQASYGNSVVTGSTLPIHSSDWSMMPGILLDASPLVGLKRGAFHVGISAGVSESQLDIRGDSTLRSLGITDAGSASIRAWSLGGFALLTTRTWYAGAAAGGSWGEAQTENTVLGAKSDFDGSSLTSSLFMGSIVPLPQDLRLDVRGTLGYHRTQGDAHHDTLDIAYGEHVLEHLSGTLSARLFTVIPAGTYTLRPYVQAGVTHRFYYANDVNIQGVDFSFEDADTSLFAAGGIDLEISEWLQLSAGIRQDHSPDYDYLSGRFGVLLKLY